MRTTFPVKRPIFELIREPGKFAGGPRFAPHFWQKGRSGMADSNDGHLMTFKVNLEDREKFPELIDVLYVSLWEDDEGFVHSSVLERSE